jgi:peroxiredoxin
MSRNNKSLPYQRLKYVLLNVSLLAAVLLLLFMLQGSQSLLPQTEITRRAAEMSLPADHSVTTLQMGSKAPDFSLTDVNGDAVSLSAHAGGKVALVFGNNGCPTCHALLDGLPQLCSASSVPILVIMVSPKPAQQAKGSCPQLLNGTPELFKSYGVTGVPTVYLVDGKQQIIASKSHFSSRDTSELVAEMKSFLQQ